MIKRLFNFIQTEKNRNRLSAIAPIILLLYLLIGVSAYINWFPGSARFFYSSSITGILARVLSTLILVVYSFLVFIANKQRIKIRWLIVLISLLLLVFISIFITNHSYYFTFRTQLYGFLTSKEIVVGYKTLLTMYLSSISDFAVAFCFIFMLPFAFRKKRTILYITIPVVLFMIFQCGYSLIFERAKYIKMMSSESDIYSGYDVSIGAMFGDKQEFGAFLTVGFACAVLSIYLLREGKLFSKLLIVLCAISLALFLVVSLLSGCKTATLSNLLILLFCFVGLLFRWYRHKRVLFCWMLGISSIIFVGIILFLSIPSLHSSGLTQKVYNMIYNRFLSKIFGGVDSRNVLSLAFFENASPSVIMFGLSKGAVQSYMQGIILDGQSSIHTGFTYFYASYGLFGFIIYMLLLCMVIKSILKVIRIKMAFGFMLLGLFVATLVFNISEAEVLIISSSAPIYVFNILVVSYPKSIVTYDEGHSNKNCLEGMSCEI